MKIKRKYITKFQARITCYEVKEMLCEEQRVNVEMSVPSGAIRTGLSGEENLDEFAAERRLVAFL